MTSGEGVDGEDESKMLKGRQFVYKELVATEADYVRDLECVVNVSGLAPGFRVLPTLGQWWSGPTTTQKILPPLSFRNSLFLLPLSL